jgi:hypothetical protein
MRDVVAPALVPHPERRDPAVVEKALAAAAERQRDLTDLASRLAAAGPYEDPAIEGLRRASEDYIQSAAQWCALAVQALKGGPKWQEEFEAFEAQEENVARSLSRWRKALAQANQGK